MGKALKVVKRFHKATDSKSGKGLGIIVPEDIAFVGPLKTRTGSQDYLELGKHFLRIYRASIMLKQFEKGNDVCSTY